MHLDIQKICQHMKQSALAYVVLVASLTLTVGGWYYMQRTANLNDVSRFRSDTLAAEKAFDRRLTSYLDIFNGLGALFALKQQVGLRDFSAFLDHYNLADHCPGIFVVGFSARVPAGQREANEAFMRHNGHPEYHIYPLGKRAEYYPAIYMYPYDLENMHRSERNSVGLDMSADPRRRLAMEEARDTGMPVATNPVTFVNEKSGNPGMIVYYPIYASGSYINGILDRRKNLIGFVYIAFHLHDFFANAVPREIANEIRFDVYDAGLPDKERMVYDGAGKESPLDTNARFDRFAGFHLAGQELTVHYLTQPAFDLVSASNLPRYVALFGLLISMMLYGFVLQRTRVSVARKQADESRLKMEETNRNSAILRESEERFRSMFEQATVGIAQISLQGAFMRVNQRFCEIVGYPADELTTMTFQAITHAQDKAAGEIALNRLFAGECEAISLEKRYVRKDGTFVWASLSISLGYDVLTHQPKYMLSLIEDITDRKVAEDALRGSEAKFRATIEHSPVGVTRFDLNGAWLQVNHKFCEIVGYASEELLAGRYADIMHPEDIRPLEELLRQLATGASESFSIEKRYIRKGGSLVWANMTASLIRDAEGHPEYYLCVIEDISERKENEQRLSWLAQYDALTGLPNRHLFRDRLNQAMNRANRNNSHVALIFLDIDKFKEINDHLGHASGDLVLKLVAERVRNCLRETDTVARLGGDEFTVILEDITGSHDAADAAEKILNVFSDPFMLEGMEFFLSTSIGITLYPSDAESMDDMLKKADLAMYQAKEHGRNGFEFFNINMDLQSAERLNLKNQLRHALERGEFFLHYQPQIDLVTQQMIGVEALIRWQSPEFGLVPPSKFVPLLEETGMILPVGEWVLKTACAQNKAWQKQGLPPIRVAVNLSARQLRHTRLGEDINRVIRESGLDPRYLELEITEGMLIENMQYGRNLLERLRATGVNIALDDFGTGYSSLSYLKNLPLDVLKMDGSFVRHLATETQDDRQSAAIVRAIIMLAHSLDLKVVAEAVETEDQREVLKHLGCDHLQGYLFSKPLPADKIPRLLQRRIRKIAVNG